MPSAVEFVDKHKIFGKLYSLHKINSVDCALFSVFYNFYACGSVVKVQELVFLSS